MGKIVARNPFRLCALAALAALGPGIVWGQTPGRFTAIGNMTTPRYGHTATLLADSRVLITGGRDVHNEMLSSAELYDPSTGMFTSTGSMVLPRYHSNNTLLRDGRVLIVGGTGLPGGVANAELYDPATGTFSLTGNITPPQFLYGPTLLNSGEVLVLVQGGSVEFTLTPPTRAELYDPVSGAFTATGNGSWDWSATSATLLTDGTVLIAGGPDTQGIFRAGQLYDPVSGTFTPVGNGTTLCYWNTATLLTNGNVLLAGGGQDDIGIALASAALFNPVSAKFIPTGDMITARLGHTATLLPDGTVFVAGGYAWASLLNSAERYDPFTGAFTAAGNLTTGRALHTATLLDNGMVLLAGGSDSTWQATASAELYNPSLLMPALVITFDRTNVAVGTSYFVSVSGSNLTSQTFFDIRFKAPGSNAYDVALNWQRSLAAGHEVSAGTAIGGWTINGVRPHQGEADHTGGFVPVSATIAVSP